MAQLSTRGTGSASNSPFNPWGMSTPQASGSSEYAPLPDMFRPGLTAIVVCSGISCATSFSLLCFLSYQGIKTVFSRNRGRSVISNAPLSYFWLVQLFVADFIESFASLFVIRYLTTNSLITGRYCNFQAVGLIWGVMGSAIWTFVITINTFLLLVGGRNTRAWLIDNGKSGWGRWVVCAAIWIFILVSGLAGFMEPFDADRGPYYDQLGTGWCYIGQGHLWESMLFTYSFLFLDMATLTILYSVLFFFLRAQTKHLIAGNTTDHQTTDNLRMTARSHWEVTLGTEGDDVESAPPRPDGGVMVTKSVAVYTESPTNSRTPRPNAPARRTYNRINKVSVTLLIYPILYILLTMPISISRIAQFAGQQWGLAFAHFGAALFSCTGFINVLLYTITRKGIVSWSRLKFWNRGENDLRRSTGRTGRWNPQGAAGDEMVRRDSVQMARLNSKTSASSIRALKEELAKGAGHQETESDGESHVESQKGC